MVPAGKSKMEIVEFKHYGHWGSFHWNLLRWGWVFLKRRRILGGIWFTTHFIEFTHAAIFFSQVPKKCTDLYISLLYFLMLGTYNKFARENNFLVLGVCFAQPCWSASRRFATSESHYYRRIVSFPQQQKFDEMRCKLDSTQNPLSLEKYPTPPS